MPSFLSTLDGKLPRKQLSQTTQIDTKTSTRLGAGGRQLLRLLTLQSDGGSRRGWMAVLLVLLAGVSLTTIALVTVSRSEQRRRDQAFDKRAGELAANVRTHLHYPLETLWLLPAFFEASEKVSRAEFLAFVRGALKRHKEVYAYQWLPIVKHDERQEYEERARQEGISDFKFKDVTGKGGVKTAAQRDEYIPIFYEEPRNPLALGIDVVHNPQQAAAVAKSRRQVGLVASEPFRLVEKPSHGLCVAVYHAVHDGPGRGDGRGKVVGLVRLILSIDDVMDKALEKVSHDDLDIALVDDTDKKQLLYENDPGSHRYINESELSWSDDLTFADDKWTLEIAPRPGSTLYATGLHWLLALGGYGVTVFLAFMLSSFVTISKLRKTVRVAMELGQYKLEEKIGEGGVGQVYRASHAMLKRPTAVKLIRPERSDQNTTLRFEREVQCTAQLTHPNTIEIYDFGRTPDGIFYYAMQFLTGFDLSNLVKRFGPLPSGRVIHILSQACGSLAEAHGKDMVHRDIKPHNIHITECGGEFDFVKVLDFGLVKQVDEDSDSGITRAGKITGTPQYMSPEAIRDPGKVDSRSDLYSLGAVGYYLLTGHHVFEGSSMVEILNSHLHNRPVPPSSRIAANSPEIDKGLELLILQCLEKKPSARPASATSLRAEMAKCESAGKWTNLEATAWWRRHFEGGSSATEVKQAAEL